MQITPHVHALRLPFRIQVSPSVAVERFVYAYLIYGSRVCLIDGGVAGYRDVLFDYLARTGRRPADVGAIVLTHAHPDHMGGALAVQNATGCMIAAHQDDLPWIEDVDLQCRERPVPGFQTLVEGSLHVDQVLHDGDTVGAGDVTLRVIHTPGHAAGHIALYYEPDHVLFSGDAVPLPGTAPIYDDVPASLRSLEALQAVPDVRWLLSSWDEPRAAAAVAPVIAAGAAHIRRVHDCVRAGHAAHPSAGVRGAGRRRVGRPGPAGRRDEPALREQHRSPPASAVRRGRVGGILALPSHRTYAVKDRSVRCRPIPP